jgi:S1-C subfamily serine protease
MSPGETYSYLIETNAAMTQLTAAAALVNLAGEVLSNTSLKLATAGVAGMDYAKNVADSLPVIQRLSR